MMQTVSSFGVDGLQTGLKREKPRRQRKLSLRQSRKRRGLAVLYPPGMFLVSFMQRRNGTAIK
eukprot:scaffold249152_cov19-Tisochrysis_lutea.AAC.1